MRADLFWSKVEAVGECLIWTACRNAWGYGVVKFDRKTQLAHRVAYELEVGPIPEGMQLDHFGCDTPACVNPDHLRPVTPRENALRSTAVSAVNLAKTHCNRGHPLEGDNLRIEGSGARRCKECHNARARERYRARQRR